MTNRPSRTNYGRTPLDDLEDILAYISARVRSGMSLTNAAKGGLAIFGFEETADGTYVRVLKRFIPASTLLRRYRKHLKDLNQGFHEATTALRQEGARLIGFANAPRAPLSFTHNEPLKRGRPKKRPLPPKR